MIRPYNYTMIIRIANQNDICEEENKIIATIVAIDPIPSFALFDDEVWKDKRPKLEVGDKILLAYFPGSLIPVYGEKNYLFVASRSNVVGIFDKRPTESVTT